MCAGPLGVETLSFGADGKVGAGSRFGLPGANGHDLTLDLSGLSQGTAFKLSSSEITAPALTQTTASLATAGLALVVDGGGTVLLGGQGQFAGGVEIKNGVLELGASGHSAAWGGGATQHFQVATHDAKGAPITLDVYTAQLTSSIYELTVYDAADAAAGGGFPYKSGPLATAEIPFGSNRVSIPKELTITPPRARRSRSRSASRSPLHRWWTSRGREMPCSSATCRQTPPCCPAPSPRRTTRTRASASRHRWS
jgi:hypothetical protein